MTSREHFNNLIEPIENGPLAELTINILESDDIDEVKSKLHELYNNLIALISKNEEKFYKYFNETKDGHLKELGSLIKKLDESKDIEFIRPFGPFLYDSIVVATIRNYAYDLHLKGGINNFVQLANDMQDCYLDTLKDNGEYDEWKGSEYPDVDASIGDGPKLEGYDKGDSI